MPGVDDALIRSTVFRRLSPEDRQRLAGVAQVRTFARNERIFAEGDAPDFFFTILAGRAKITKTTPAGKDIILELFGQGDPLGAVAAYEGRPFPASAVAIEETTCLAVPRREFFQLLEQYPSLVRGMLLGLTLRLVELTNRIAELTGGRAEARFARLFLKMAEKSGRHERGGVFIPMPLSRQELADLTGTTIETTIRIMSRWGKEEMIRTEKDGFVLVDKEGLDAIALT